MVKNLIKKEEVIALSKQDLNPENSNKVIDEMITLNKNKKFIFQVLIIMELTSLLIIYLINVRLMMINNYKKIVIKIGSSSIINNKTKKIDSKWMSRLCARILKNTIRIKILLLFALGLLL